MQHRKRTRPDISFAISQVSRFTHHPKKSHSTAVKTIIRYLKRTEDKGTYLDQDIYEAANCLKLECFVVADFAGLYKQDPDESPSSMIKAPSLLVLTFNKF
jgi:hypothetical protein